MFILPVCLIEGPLSVPVCCFACLVVRAIFEWVEQGVTSLHHTLAHAAWSIRGAALLAVTKVIHSSHHQIPLVAQCCNGSSQSLTRCLLALCLFVLIGAELSNTSSQHAGSHTAVSKAAMMRSDAHGCLVHHTPRSSPEALTLPASQPGAISLHPWGFQLPTSDAGGREKAS